MCVYKDNGYDNRVDYLMCMADDYGIDYYVVCLIADTLGENEDFDGLINALEDYSDNL